MKHIVIVLTTALIVLQLHGILSAQPAAFTHVLHQLDLATPVVSEPVDTQLLLMEDQEREQRGGPYRFAIPRTVKITPETDGLWEEIDNETLLWRLPVASPDAVSISLGFTSYFMPPGGKLYVYSADETQVVGPFTENDNEGHGQLWTPLIYSDSIIIELTIPVSEVPQLKLVLTSINHGYRNIDPQLLYRDLGDSEWCHRNVACPEGDPWRDQIRSVALYQITLDDGTFWCTGVLVNNTAQDDKVYFLTAFHCLDEWLDLNLDDPNGAAASMVIYWNFQASTCSGTSGSKSHTQSGAIFRAAHWMTDFALVELDDTPSQSFNVFYSGWDHSNTTPSSGVAIHHPDGDLKKISIENDSLKKVDIIESGSYIEYGTYFEVSGWDLGATAEGSSGCPIYNSNKRIVGVLSFGESTCSNPGPDYFGPLYRAWTGGETRNTRLRDWLDPGNTNASHLDGKNPTKVSIVEGIVFEDNFLSSSIDRSNWPIVSGAAIYNVGSSASSPPYALWMNGTPYGKDMIESKAIDLSSSTYATLNYHYDKATLGDQPDPGDDLIISYLSTHGWEEIDRQLGVGSHMRNYRLVSIHLPEDALHANFKIRIESIGDPGVGSEIYDNWFVDDVNIISKGPGSIKIFEETFPNDLMNSPLWQKMYGVEVRGTGLNEPSPPYSLRLNGHPGNYDDVWSKKMDLSEYSRAVLSYYYARTGGYESPDDGDDLIISYMSTHGWVEIDRQLGSGPDMWTFSDQIRLNLPSDAMHENFMFRIQSIGTANPYYIYDDWFVDDIVVEVWR